MQDELFPICAKEVETVEHVLWECAAAQDVWSGSSRKLQKSKLVDLNIMGLVEYIHGSLSREDAELFIITAKATWSRRNAVIHGGAFSHPSTLAREAIALQQAFKEANICDNGGTAESNSQQIVWKNPLQGVYRVNWDVAISKKMKTIGVGIVIRDAQGQGKTLSIICNLVIEEAMTLF